MRITYDMSNRTIIAPRVEPFHSAAEAPGQHATSELKLQLQEVEWSADTPSSEPTIWASGVSIKDLLK